jgi:hypothetical protein
LNWQSEPLWQFFARLGLGLMPPPEPDPEDGAILEANVEALEQQFRELSDRVRAGRHGLWGVQLPFYPWREAPRAPASGMPGHG